MTVSSLTVSAYVTVAINSKSSINGSLLQHHLYAVYWHIRSKLEAAIQRYIVYSGGGRSAEAPKR